MKRIFIVDDHPVFREGLCCLIRGEAGLAVCGQADSAAAALKGIEKSKPDLVLADLSLAGRSGLELIKDVHAVLPAMPVLVISMYDETLYAERAMRAGASGYIMKQEGAEKVLEGIRQVLNGQIFMSAKTSIRLLRVLSGRGEKRAPAASRLTDREFEVLRLIGHGMDTQEIARELGLSRKTIDTHNAHLRDKLELENSTQLIRYAAHWVETEPAAVKWAA